MFRFIKTEKDGVITYSLTGNLHERYKESFLTFNNAYTLQNVLVNIEDIVPQIISKTKRECRYCGLSYPTVKFKKDAHIISELLGNKNLVSDFECDNCNEIFSKYENDLAYFLGFTRTFLQTKVKKGVPTYKAPDKSITVKEGIVPEIDNQPKVIFEFAKRKKETIKVNKYKKQLTIETTKHSYRPFNIYKILLKMAIGAMPKEELNDYTVATKLITNKINIQPKKSSLFKAFYTFIPGFSFPSPMLAIFKKKNAIAPYPTHIATLYCLNSIFQIALPNLESDMWLYDGKQKVEFLKVPPLIDKQIINYFGFPQSRILDLDNEDLVKREKHSITISFDNSKKLFPIHKTSRIIKKYKEKIRKELINQLFNHVEHP